MEMYVIVCITSLSMIFLYNFHLVHVQRCEKWASFVGLQGQFQEYGFG